MTGILDKFHVEHGIHGAKVMTRSNQLSGDCISDDEIDTAIQMLKDDLELLCEGDETPPGSQSARLDVRGLAVSQRRYRERIKARGIARLSRMEADIRR